MQFEKPWYVQFEAGVLLTLFILRVIGFIVVLRPSDLSQWEWARVIVTTIATGVAGWWLWKGLAWGYLLSVALAGYWLLYAAWLIQSSPAHGQTLETSAGFHLVLGCIVLVGLLMPGSVKWFREAWASRTEKA
jgi:hypothetical protein